MTPKDLQQCFRQIEGGIDALLHAATHPDAASRYGVPKKVLRKAAHFLKRTSLEFEDFHADLNKEAQSSTSDDMLTVMRGPDKDG